MADSKLETQLPDWWQREKQVRQGRLLILLALVLALIVYFYYESSLGITGTVGGVTFDTSDHIAFVRQQPDGSTDIYCIRADGTDLRPLTKPDDKSDKSAPAWTIDGKNVLYASNRADSKKTQIYILGAEEPKQITYGAERKDAPIADPDGKHVAFLTQGAIKTVYLNGNEVNQLLPEPRAGNENTGDNPVPTGMPDPKGPYLSAAFAPDGLGIAGVQTVSDEESAEAAQVEGYQIARALPANADAALSLNSFGRYVNVQWEPNGKRLMVAYAERALTDETGQNYIKDASGHYVNVSGISIWSFDNPKRPLETPVVKSADNSFMPRNVAWSPDGKRIAFEGWELSKEGERKLRGIYMFNVPDQPVAVGNGSGLSIPPPTLPASAAGVPSTPRWSPDGSRLLYELIRPDNGHDLIVINADMTNKVNLTNGQGDNTQAVWSPAKNTH